MAAKKAAKKAAKNKPKSVPQKAAKPTKPVKAKPEKCKKSTLPPLHTKEHSVTVYNTVITDTKVRVDLLEPPFVGQVFYAHIKGKHIRCVITQVSPVIRALADPIEDSKRKTIL